MYHEQGWSVSRIGVFDRAAAGMHDATLALQRYSAGALITPEGLYDQTAPNAPRRATHHVTIHHVLIQDYRPALGLPPIVHMHQQ